MWSILSVFVKGVRPVSKFIFFFFCMCISSCSSTICWKDLSWLHCIAFPPLSKIQWLYLCGAVSRLCILVFRLFVCYLPTPYILDYCSFIVRLKVVYFLIDIFLGAQVYFHLLFAIMCSTPTAGSALLFLSWFASSNLIAQLN